MTSRGMFSRAALAASLSMLWLVSSASATVSGEPLEFRVLRAPAAGNGEGWIVDIVSGRSGQLSGFIAAGEGLAITGIAAGSAIPLDEGTPLRLTVQTEVRRPSPRLTIRYHFDGQPYHSTLDLGGDAGDVSAGSLQPIAPTPNSNVRDAPAASSLNPPVQASRAAGRGHKSRLEATIDLAPAQTNSRNITVHGRIVYQRSDGTIIGADNATVEVYDADITFDQLKATTGTDEYGNYSATFNWDPCPFVCEQNPDIYVRVEARNGAATVETANLEITYGWESGTTSNFTGTDLDKGTLQPGSDQEALHILTDITRGWRWSTTRGYSPPAVEVKWPANSISTTYYNPIFETIHLLQEDRWIERTHLHEYGHHWTNRFGAFEIPTYTDPHCGIFGHCGWCSENETAAFIEGWADWFSDITTKSFLPTYGIASLTTDDAEHLAQCTEDAAYNSAYSTEMFFAALLRDIEDSVNEDDPAFPGDGWRDALAIGTDEVLAVADLDAPLTPRAFMSSFKTRFPSLACELWETGRNNGFDLDAQPPSAPTALAAGFAGGVIACGPPRDNRRFSWVGALDDWACVSGYSIQIGATAQLPDAIADIGALTEYTTGCLSPGTYVFNIRAVDRSGKWSTEFASKSFNIDSGIAALPGAGHTTKGLLMAMMAAIGSLSLVRRRRHGVKSDR